MSLYGICTDINIAIEQYYHGSFQAEPKQCNVILPQLVGRFVELDAYLAEERRRDFNQITTLILSAMENEDWVLLRDYLYYELKPWIVEQLQNNNEVVV